MEVKYKTVLVGELSSFGLGKLDDIHSIVKLEEEPCCERMKEALEGNYIGFGRYSAYLNNNSKVNIFRRSPWTELEEEFWHEMPIQFCPFCKAEIKTIEVKRTKLQRYTKFIPSRKEEDYQEVDVE